MARSTSIVKIAAGCGTLAALLAAVWLAVVAPAARADQAACGQVVSSSITLSQSLSGCAGDGLVIGASGVTVDLNGHTLEGVGLGAGIQNNGHDDVTIRGGVVKNFDYGVLLGPGSTRNTVSGITLQQNEWSSIGLNDADHNRVQGNYVSDHSHAAISLAGGSSQNLIASNVVGAGNGEGFVVEGGSDFNRLELNAVLASSKHALRVEGSRGNLVLANQFAGGSDAAITMTAAPASAVQSNTVAASGDAAVMVADSNSVVVRFNDLSQSQDAGVILSTVGDSLVKGNLLAGTGDAAVLLREQSNGNRVIDNQASGSSDAGISISDGVLNTVRGNVLVGNATGVELAGASFNNLEFNAVRGSLGIGFELEQSAGNNVYGNTLLDNLGGGIWVGAAVGAPNTIQANEVRRSGSDGIEVNAAGAVVRGNLATHNQGWGIHAVAEAVDGGGNGAHGNAEAAQCYLIACSDGAGWQPPARPPEPVDPLEVGLPSAGRVGAPARLTRGGPTAQGRRRGARRARGRRLATIRCKRRRAARGRARVVCKVSYRAKSRSRRLSGRLVRGGRSYARGARRVRPSRRGTLVMRARKRPAAGRYTVRLMFRDRRGRAVRESRPVRVR